MPFSEQSLTYVRRAALNTYFFHLFVAPASPAVFVSFVSLCLSEVMIRFFDAKMF